MAHVPQLFAGVMSGTSLDGVDAVVVDFAPGDGKLCAPRRQRPGRCLLDGPFRRVPRWRRHGR